MGGTTKIKGFRGVLVKKTANQPLVSGITTTLTWQQAQYDVENIWDGNQLLTPPPGVVLVRLYALVMWATGAAGIRFAELSKSGPASLVDGRTFSQKPASSATARQHMLVSAPIRVATDGGPYFVRAQHTQGAALVVNLDSWFGMEVII